MNKLTIIGNLTKDPELNTTPNGHAVCNFTIAVNQRKPGEPREKSVQFFRVTVWRQLGEICNKYLAKGRKVCVVGPVSVRTYQANDGSTKVQLEVVADDIEFLSSRNEADAMDTAWRELERRAIQQETNSDFTAVEDADLPF